MECEYKIDDSNRVVAVSENWDLVAANNEAADLTQERILGADLNKLLYDEGSVWLSLRRRPQQGGFPSASALC
jgi:hypothetical protein